MKNLSPVAFDHIPIVLIGDHILNIFTVYGTEDNYLI